MLSSMTSGDASQADGAIDQVRFLEGRNDLGARQALQQVNASGKERPGTTLIPASPFNSEAPQIPLRRSVRVRQRWS